MKQIGGLLYPLIGTFDDLVFYKLGDEYYARKKSTLSGKRVKTSPEFRRTMVCASLLVRASRIGAQVYKTLPPRWRQFWMYRGFTGEAFILLQDNPFSDEEVTALLWKCYVEYWEQRKAADPDNPIFQPKPKKIRKPRKYSEESIQRMLKRKGKDGKPKWRDLEEEERKRQRKAMNDACYERTMEKYRRREEEKRRALEGKPRALEYELQAAGFEPRALEQEVPALSQRVKDSGIKVRRYKSRRTMRRHPAALIPAACLRQFSGTSRAGLCIWARDPTIASLARGKRVNKSFRHLAGRQAGKEHCPRGSPSVSEGYADRTTLLLKAHVTKIVMQSPTVLATGLLP